MNETNGAMTPSPGTAATGESEAAGNNQSDSERRRGLLMRLRGAWKPRAGANLRDDLTGKIGVEPCHQARWNDRSGHDLKR